MAGGRFNSNVVWIMRDLKKSVNDRFLPSLSISLVLFGLTIVLLGGEWLVSYGALAAGSFGVLLVFDYHLWRKGRTGTCHSAWLLLLMLLLSFAARFSLLNYQTVDYHTISSWYSYIGQHGGVGAWKDNFSNYPPLFLYMLTALTYLPVGSLWSIKFLSIVFDYVAGWWAYKLVKLKYPSGLAPVGAFFAVVFAPTVVINGSLWGQSDVIYTSFLMASLYFLMRLSGGGRRESHHRDLYLALIMFGVAFSLKPQSVFFVLPLIFLYLSRRARWHHFLLVPLVYFVTLLPSFWVGRPLGELLFLYVNQVRERIQLLSVNAPSVYQLLPIDASFYSTGLIFCVSAVLFFSFWFLYKRVPFSRDNVIKVAMVSFLVIPYFLPGMHERYFFPADVMAIIFAFYWPRFWYLPLVVGGVSLLSYSEFLTGQKIFDYQILALVMGVIVAVVVRDFLAGSVFIGGHSTDGQVGE